MSFEFRLGFCIGALILGCAYFVSFRVGISFCSCIARFRTCGLFLQVFLCTLKFQPHASTP